MERILKYRKILKESGDWILFAGTGTKDDTVTVNPSGDWGITREEFESCPFLEYIFRGVEPIFVVLNGSCAGAAVKESSDYDLEVFIEGDGITDYYTEYSLCYKGRPMHWYYITKNRGNIEAKMKGLYRSALMNYHWQKQENVLWSAGTDRAEKSISVFLSEAKAMALEISKIYLRFLQRKDKLNDIQLMPEDHLCELTKLSWQIYFQACLLLNEEIDAEIILDLKQIRYRPITQEHKERFLELLRKEQETIPQISVEEYEALKADLISKWESIWA